MTKEICQKLDSTDLDKLDEKNIEMEMGMLIAPALLKYTKDAQEIYGIKDVEILFEKVGQDLGMQLVMECPSMMKLAMKMAGNEEYKEKKAARKAAREKSASEYGRAEGDDTKNKVDDLLPPPLDQTMKIPEATAMSNYSVSNGKLLTINQGDFTTITIKDMDGSTAKLYWLEYFENADELSKNSKKYVGKNVIYKYEEKEIYNAATKKYKTIKVIKSVELD
jgi:hypothetical protein